MFVDLNGDPIRFVYLRLFEYLNFLRVKSDFIVNGECNTLFYARFYVINNKIRQFLVYFGSFPVVFLLKKTAALKI